MRKEESGHYVANPNFCSHFLRKATVATRDPTDPPNMKVGYVLTWLRYSNGGCSILFPAPASEPLAAESPPSVVDKFSFLMLKFSTSSKSSSFVLLHDVITFLTEAGIKIKKFEVSFNIRINSLLSKYFYQKLFTNIPPGATSLDTESQYMTLKQTNMGSVMCAVISSTESEYQILPSYLLTGPSGCKPMASKVPLSITSLNFCCNFVSSISST